MLNVYVCTPLPPYLIPRYVPANSIIICSNKTIENNNF